MALISSVFQNQLNISNIRELNFTEAKELIAKNEQIYATLYDIINNNKDSIISFDINIVKISDVLNCISEDRDNREQVLSLALSNFSHMLAIYCDIFGTDKPIELKAAVALFTDFCYAANIRRQSSERILKEQLQSLSTEITRLSDKIYNLQTIDNSQTGDNIEVTSLVTLIRNHMSRQIVITQNEFIVGNVWIHSKVLKELEKFKDDLRNGIDVLANQSNDIDQTRQSLIKSYRKGIKAKERKCSREEIATMMRTTANEINKQLLDETKEITENRINKVFINTGISYLSSSLQHWATQREETSKLRREYEIMKREFVLNKNILRDEPTLIYAWRSGSGELEIYKQVRINDYARKIVNLCCLENIVERDFEKLRDGTYQTMSGEWDVYKQNNKSKGIRHLQKLVSVTDNGKHIYTDIDLRKDNWEAKRMTYDAKAAGTRCGSYAIPVHGQRRGTESWEDPSFAIMTLSDVIGGLTATFTKDVVKCIVFVNPPATSNNNKVAPGIMSCDITIEDGSEFPNIRHLEYEPVFVASYAAEIKSDFLIG